MQLPPYSMPTSCLLFSLVAAALCGVATARAANVIYSGVQDIPIPTDFAGVYLDPDTGATGWDINPFFGGVGIANSAAFQPCGMGLVLSMPM